MCDRVVIIDKGKIVADDTTKNLSKLVGSTMQFSVEFKEKVNEKQLRTIKHVSNITKVGSNEWIIETKGNKDIRQEIFQFAVDHKYNVLSLSQSEQNMEDVFRRLTKK